MNLRDDTGLWPSWKEIKKGLKKAWDWADDNIFQPIGEFFEDIGEDLEAFDTSNQSEEKVLESNYFSFYKGHLVIRTNLDRSGSFGFLFISRDANKSPHPEDEVRHEYGHTVQLKQLGIVKYALCIGIPSLFEWGSDSEYYRRPWEITADIYGGVQSRSYPGYEYEGFQYLAISRLFGIIAWATIE